MQAKHEKLALRLTDILIQLNSGNRLSAKALAEKYQVSLKTIKRDLELRLIELPWKEEGPEYYAIDTKQMHNISVDAIERFCRFGACTLFCVSYLRHRWPRKRSSKCIVNQFIANLQFCIGIVHFFDAFITAK